MKSDDIEREIQRMIENRRIHYSNTDNPVDFPNIKAGADIHAGDGGYSIGTPEAHAAFVAKREESMVIPKLGSGVNFRPTWPDEE